jgi:Flp pilus assembly protein TadD
MGKKLSNRNKGKRTGERKDRNSNTLLFIIFSAVIIICILAIIKLFLFKIKNSDERQNKITTEIKIPPATFVGSNVCARCHEEQYKLWRGSDHDRAMQIANEKTVLGDFNGAEFNYFGVKSNFFKKEGKFMIRTDGPDGNLEDYEIKYTFGHYPLQQYLIEFPGGRLQALGIAWDSRPESEGGERWFHLYPNEKITHTDSLHWTGPNQNWNYMCAECHSTNLQKNYDPDSDSFNTTWSEINVSCEACHGPGSRHVEWAENIKDRQEYNSISDKGLVVNLGKHGEVKWIIDQNTGSAARSGHEKTNVEIEICARCHSRRDEFWEEYIYGRPLMDTHMPALLEENLYYPDGQIKDEVYEYGSFLQSKMYHKGVTCTDCHNPHSLKLRESGNGVCAECHLSSKYDSPSHHFHKISSSGASCIGCHMPPTKYMVIDPRHDHSIRIPRPDLSVKVGTPNACNMCHSEHTPQWADENINKWYAKRYKGYQNYAEALDAGRTGAPLAEELLADLAQNATAPNIARATALSELHRYLSPASIEAVRLGLSSDDPMIRAAALDALEAVEPGLRLRLAFNILNDPVRTVRIKAVTVLASVPRDQLTAGQSRVFDNAVDEYVEAQFTNAERPESHLNIGLLYVQLGRFTEAESEYQTAIKLQPSFVPAYVNLADLYRILGKDSEGESLLRNALLLSPQNADVYHALGLLFVREKRISEAVEALEKSARLRPDNPHYSYVYAVALNTEGKKKEAIEFLIETHDRHPNDREILYALVTFNRDGGNVEAAKNFAQKLIELSPNDPSFRNLLDQLQIQDK